MKLSSGIAVAALAGIAASASGQAVVGFTGGAQFGIFYASSTGDVVGWRFNVDSSIVVTDLGVWNADTQVGFEGLTSDHMVGIWDSSGTLLTSTLVTVAGSVAVGDWNYEATANVVLNPGETYTIGAMYTAFDGDSYISSPSSVTTAAGVNVLNGVFPDAGDLGFVFPGSDSTNLGRFGPNFLFIPTPGAISLLALGGLAAARRRR